jgi:D-lactate dehydrogenase (cytochrome)
MPTNKLLIMNVLTEEEYQKIDNFCVKHSGEESLPQIAAFLKEQFSLDLTTDSDVVSGFIADSSNLPGTASALLRPSSQRECAIIFRVCYKAGIPYTISAGRSNLTGSATPNNGIVISTTFMMSPEPEVDRSKMIIKAPVGIILEELRNLVLEQSQKKFIFPVNPTSRSDAAVGGAIACNASGFTPGDIGSIRSWVDSIEFLLPNGMKISAKKGDYISSDGKFILCQGGDESDFPVPLYERTALKNASGPFSSSQGVMDFIDLVVGSEGLFGMVMACTLNLQNNPSDYMDIFFSLSTEDAALQFLGYLRNQMSDNLSSLSALEYFGIHCREYMEHQGRLFRGDDEVGIYIQVPLTDKTIEDAAEEWFEILMNSECDIKEEAIILLDNDRDRKIFMEARHSLPANSLEVVQNRGTFTIMTDTVVPPSNFAAFLDYTNGLIRSEGMDYLSFGHMGDCHLHFMILPEKEQLARAAELYDMIVAKSSEMGGVYSGEHGTGKRKRKDFLKCYGAQAVEEVRRCKAAVDPLFLLNRGNVFLIE